MSKQLLGDRKIRRLREQFNKDFIYGEVSHNHRVELYTRTGEVYIKYQGRLTKCEDPPHLFASQELLDKWEVMDGD